MDVNVPSMECLRCHRIDYARKIGSIVDEGTFDATPTSAFAFNSSVHGETLLARRLSSYAPGPRPITERNLGFKLAYLAAIIFGIFGVLLALGGLFESGNPLNFPLPFAVAVAPYFIVRHLHRKATETELRGQLIAWEAQVERWGSTYYCGRCDFVYQAAKMGGSQSAL